jgi:sugar lactone lactonase YvrE
MQKLVALFFIIVSAAYIAGCGGSSTTDVPPVDYVLTTQTSASIPGLMGGSIQSTLPLTLDAPATVTTFSGSTPGFRNYTSAGSISAQFKRPIALTTAGGNLYVADYYNHAIRKIELATGFVTTIAGNVFGFSGSADNTGTAASFYLPSGITTDGTNLYVTDSGNYSVRKIVISTGVVTTLAGGGGSSVSGTVDATGLAARFNVLNGITTDGTCLYVTDSNNTIRRIVISSGAVATVAGTPGVSGSADGIKEAARFNQPARITTDGPNLYVTDFGYNTIRKIVLATQAVTTIAGKVGPGGEAGFHADSTDGTGLTARFNQPNGITTDGTNLYVVDSYDNTIRKIVINGPVGTTYSGPVTTVATNGTAAENTTIGITTNGTSLFITDMTTDNLNHRIREIK